MIEVADSITKLGVQLRGKVLVAGSHAGRYCGYLAARAGLRGVVLSDAGVGKDAAGIGALAYLDALGVAAAAVAHTSARIGDGADLLRRGRVSHHNRAAAALGCAVGMPCREAAEALRGGTPYAGEVPPHQEGRFVLRAGAVPVIGCDSAALVRPDDAGAIIVTGSHGGVLAGRPGYGVAAAARAAVFNDAGVGIDDAGIQRLAVLDAAGIAGVTVAADSAAIGDARSAWECGMISHVNQRAVALGVSAGMSVPQLADLLGEGDGGRWPASHGE